LAVEVEGSLLVIPVRNVKQGRWGQERVVRREALLHEGHREEER
jgi:hypothetical protein